MSNEKMSLGVVRAGLKHLLNGLDPEILDIDGGDDLIEERIAALPDNVRLIVEAGMNAPIGGSFSVCSECLNPIGCAKSRTCREVITNDSSPTHR